MGLEPTLRVEVVPFGPGQETMSRIRSICDHHPDTQSFLQGTRHLCVIAGIA